MKTTLTQAWEATGLAGMILRSKVAWKIIGRFYKENPDKNKAAIWFSIYLLFAMLGGIVAYIFGRFVLPFVAGLDLSLSINLLIVFVELGTLILLVVFTVALTRFAVLELMHVGSIDRYIFQHRDDEVEL